MVSGFLLHSFFFFISSGKVNKMVDTRIGGEIVHMPIFC